MIIKIKNEELIQELVGDTKDFPLYTTQILNLANQNAHGTRPKVVGQLSELIQECPKKTYEGWKEWYLERHPEALSNATERINEMVHKLRKAMGKIDKSMVEDWVKDLVLEKTYIGLRFQEAVLKKLSEIKEMEYRLSTPEEESKGIDGYIGDIPISIKPVSYQAKKSLRENIAATIVYYKKDKTGLKIDATELFR